MRRLPVFAFVCFATAAFAATRPAALADLADRARSVPGEFAADALLRIAASRKITDPAWKLQLIEDAFAFAATAQEPYARRAWVGSQAGIMDRAYAQGLDACTLQCRAVRAMLALNPKRGREMFEQIPPPRIPRLTCEDALVYDVSIFYATLGEVAAQGFNAKEVADEQPSHLMQRYVFDVSSPAQVGPIVRLLAGAPLKPAQLELLVNSFAGTLRQLSADDRSFSATIAGDEDASAVAGLASICARRQINPAPLLEAWRAYLVKHLSGARCADTTGADSASLSFGIVANRVSSEPAYTGPLGAVRYFNENMRTGSLQPITDEEVNPAKTEGKATAAGACESLQCRQLADMFKRLVLGPTGLALTDAEKSGGDWGGQLKDYLAALADWKGDDPAECFPWKSRFYDQLFNVLPSGPDRDLVQNSLLAWLQESDYQREHHVEWFYPVNVLIIRAFADPSGLRGTLRELQKAADPVIGLYVQLEQVLPRPLQSTVGLL
jgi:hypothetical protein